MAPPLSESVVRDLAHQMRKFNDKITKLLKYQYLTKRSSSILALV